MDNRSQDERKGQGLNYLNLDDGTIKVLRMSVALLAPFFGKSLLYSCADGGCAASDFYTNPKGGQHKE